VRPEEGFLEQGAEHLSATVLRWRADVFKGQSPTGALAIVGTQFHKSPQLVGLQSDKRPGLAYPRQHRKKAFRSGDQPLKEKGLKSGKQSTRFAGLKPGKVGRMERLYLKGAVGSPHHDAQLG
jgi:hypothetical protein